MPDLNAVARAIVAERRGILAADESDGTIAKRFKSIGVESTEANRRAYRELLFTTAGIGEFISGVILFDETIRQAAADGTPFVKLLKEQGVISGIKVDRGPSRWPVRRVRRSPKDSTGFETGWLNTSSSGRSSRSGGP